MVLQRRAEGLFRAVGLNFVTRPYAIAAATSAPEIAACAEEIYGTDPDIVTWDFAMTDGRWHWRFEFFAHRIMLMHRHPSLLVLRAGFDGERRKTVEHLTDEGMAVLRLEETYLEKQTDKFPDCRYKTLEELDAMPSHIKYFRCGRAIESGVPCEDHKFTKNSTCDDRDGRTRWHQGWYADFVDRLLLNPFVAQPLLYNQEIARLPWKSVHALFDGIHRGRKSIANTPLSICQNSPSPSNCHTGLKSYQTGG
jgi:hypothetical protein